MQNYDTMTTTGASLGKSPRVTNIGDLIKMIGINKK